MSHLKLTETVMLRLHRAFPQVQRGYQEHLKLHNILRLSGCELSAPETTITTFNFPEAEELNVSYSSPLNKNTVIPSVLSVYSQYPHWEPKITPRLEFFKFLLLLSPQSLSVTVAFENSGQSKFSDYVVAHGGAVNEDYTGLVHFPAKLRKQLTVELPMQLLGTATSSPYERSFPNTKYYYYSLDQELVCLVKLNTWAGASFTPAFYM